MRLLVAVSNEPLAHAIHGALLAGRHEVSLASTGSTRSPLSPRSHLTQ